MKKLNKVLVLCAITVLVIATVFTLSACKKNPQVEGISVQIIGGGEKIELTQQDATAEKIIEKISVVATLSDETTKTITGFTVEDFDATKLDVVQTVTIKYGEFTATVSVEVKSSTSVEPQIVSIAVSVKGGGDKVTLQQANATVAAILAQIDVTATYDDNTTQSITTGLTVESFDPDTVDTVQTVTVKYGALTATVSVEVESPAHELEILEVNVSHEGSKVTLDKDTASEQALRSAITVCIVMSDDSSEQITQYDVVGLDLDKVNEDQTVTIKYGEYTTTVTVYIEDNSEPDPTPVVTAISTNVTETLVLYGVQANDIKAKLTVTATWNIGEPSVVAATDYKVTNYDKTLLDEVQTVTISYGGKSVQISVKVMQAYVVKINATLVGDVEVIELIGVNATAENILNAITVSATYNDETTGEIEQEQLTVNASTFNATQYDETQQVEICYDTVKTTVDVKVIAATPAELELDTDSVTAIGANDEEVVADIKDKLTVSVIMTDGTSDTVTNFEVTLDDGFDFADFDNEQSATITCGKLTATIAVHMIKQPKSISVNKNEVSILETVSGDTAKIAALKKAIVVTLTSTDDTQKTVSDYTVKLSALDETTYTQTATISYKGLDDSLTVQVTVLPVPKISIKGGAAAFMTADPDNTNTYVKNNVQLKRGETVAITLAGKAVAFPENFNGTAALNGTYSFAVAVDGLTATVTCTVPKYAATLKVGDVAQGEPAVNNGVYTWQVTLDIDDAITVSDNKFGNIKIGASLQYVATRSGEYTITVTPQDDKTVVDVTLPAYEVTLTVKRAGAVVNTVALTENVDTDKTDGRLSEYSIEDLTLQKGDVVVITDNEGKTLSTYENCEFNGTAPRDGDYKIYVKIYSDKNSIWVAEPAKVVTITVNNSETVTLTRKEDNEDNEEYMVEGLALTTDDTVVIRLDGDVKSNYKPGCKFNGTVYLTGTYDFYVCVDGSSADGIWVNDWVQVFHERNGNITIIPTEKSSSTDGRVKEQRKAEVALLANDEIVVRDIGGNAFGYENFGEFNGTATKDGIYTFYIKIGWERANDIIYTAYAAPTAKTLTTNVTETLVLYGVEADNIKAKLTVTATWNVGAPSEVTNYTVTGFNKTILNEEQTVTITLGEASVEITVKVMEAYAVSINAAINGEVVELIGVNATTENIMKAITAVTATLNDGTTRENVKSQCTVNAETFNATLYGTTQQVEICLGTVTTTVDVKVIAATPASLELSSKSATVTGANESEVVAAIKTKITVNVIMTDGETVSNADYTVTLVTDFNFANFETVQSATITCDGLIETISVQMIKEAKSISAAVNEITIKESSASESARLAAVKAQLVITLTMTDDSTTTITDYAVDFGNFSASNYEAQTVTLSYEGVESITVQVTVIPVPTISVNGAAAAFMTVDSANSNKYLSDNVELEHGDVVAITLAGQAVAFTGDFNGTAAINGTHTFTVTVDGATATIAVIEPEYAAVLKVNGTTKDDPTNVGGSYRWTITLDRGDIVTITDNMFGDVQIDGSIQYVATRSGVHTISVTQGTASTAVSVTQPEYAVTLTVTRDDEVANTVVLDLSDERPDECKAQYVALQLELKKDDVVTITDNDGVTHNVYKWTSFDGTAPHNGNYDFYVKIFDDASKNQIYVAVPAAPDKVVTISVSGGEPNVLVRKTDNKDHEEYMITGLELHAGESVVILVDDVEKSNYKACGFDGTAANDGTYDFYVCVDGSTEDGIWVNYHAPEVPGTVVTITVNGGTPTELTFDANRGEYIIEEVMLEQGDTVVIEKNGEVVEYRSGCGFDGTVAATGYHDFYVGDEGVWVTTAYRKVYCFVPDAWNDVGNWLMVGAYCQVNDNDRNADWPGVPMTRLDYAGYWFFTKVDVRFTQIKFTGINADGSWKSGNETGYYSMSGYDVYLATDGNVPADRPTV